MIRQRQSGKPDPYKLEIPVSLFCEIQRNHGTVIQMPVLFSERSRRKTFLISDRADFTDQFRVILLLKTHPAGPETAEISGSFFSRGNMEIVSIHNSVRAGYKNGFRFQFSDFRRNLLICPDCFPDLLFTSLSDFGNDHRRMRDHICRDNRHEAFLPASFLFPSHGS